nr:hypothetical protein [Tanacetum cinerariifolium]
MDWFLRCSWCGGPFNGGNCRHCTDVSYRDEPVYDSNPNSHNQTPDFSNPPPNHNYKIDSRSDTRTAFQAEFEKFQQNFERFMAQLRCSNCGGLFNGGNCLSCSIVGYENEFVHVPNPLPYDNTLEFSYQPPQHHGDDDYDYKESTLPLNEINSRIPPFILITTSPPVLPTEDPEDSLKMGNEEFGTIPEKESDEFIKSSVEDLIPILSESEDTSESESVCILLSCDDFSPIDVPKEKAVTFSNPLFNSNDDFISSDDESLSDEDRNIESKDSYDSNLDEPDLLVTPLSDANNNNECFDSGGDDDEINVLDYEDSYYGSEGDILYLESSLNDDPSIPAMSVASILEGFTDEPPLEENDDLFDLESKNDE